MAGIEKRCEISGDYCGWEMYGWKYNSIQVKPEFRSLFKGKDFFLVAYPCDSIYLRDSSGALCLNKEDFSKTPDSIRKTPKKTDIPSDSHVRWHKGKVVRGWWFCLSVPEVPGVVRGEFINHTYDMKAVLHHLRKLLGLRSIRQLKLKTYQSRDAALAAVLNFKHPRDVSRLTEEDIKNAGV